MRQAPVARQFPSRSAASLHFVEFQYDTGDDVARTTVNRPHTYNVDSPQTRKELATTLRPTRFDDVVGGLCEAPLGPPLRQCKARGANNLLADHYFYGACGQPL